MENDKDLNFLDLLETLEHILGKDHVFVIDEHSFDEPSEPVKWSGTWPARCNRCNRDLSTVKVFYDCATTIGSWGLFCHSCWHIVSFLKLGTGFGQKYNSKTLLKLEG